MKKKLAVFLFLFLTILTSCVQKNMRRRDYSGFNPLTAKPEYDGLDFVALHNDVLTYMMSEKTPFFYVKENTFDISGSNSPKVINVKAICLNGTVEEEAKLFLSMVLNYIGYVSSEQVSEYEQPKMDRTNTYIDFGTVFNDYDLDIDVKDDKGNILVKTYVKAGSHIPVEPRYWKE